jgi:malonyl-CoA O-methyltransferase
MAPPAAPRRPIDEVATRRIAQRLARAGDPPWLHHEVARRLAERLATVKRTPRRIVDASGWIGAGEALLARQYPDAQRWRRVDRAAPARAAAPWWRRLLGRASESVGLAPDQPWPTEVGLVWSNMMLHADPDPPAEFARWLAALEVDGFVMFSCLGPGTLAELRSLYAAEAWGPAGAALVDMHDLGDMLVHAGFADPVMDQETLTLTWPDAQAALAECRALGGNAAPDRFPGCRTPAWRDRLLAAIAALAPGAPVQLSFEIVYGHAFKGPPRATPPAETTISLDAMRGLVRSARDRD